MTAATIRKPEAVRAVGVAFGWQNHLDGAIVSARSAVEEIVPIVVLFSRHYWRNA